MRFYLKILLAFLMFSATAQRVMASEIVHAQLDSKILSRKIAYNVYLPDHYQNSGRLYPVIYLLHGADEDENSWVERGGVKQTLDGLINRGLIPPMVAVIPTVGPLSWWIDGAEEKAESVFLNEVIPDAQAHYPITSQVKGRAIAGLSMGGYGALNIVLRHPEEFCAAGIISPAIYDPAPPQGSAARRSKQFMQNGRFSTDLWNQFMYTQWLPEYQKSNVRVPMWIQAGDHDHFGIAFSSARLFSQLRAIQPQQLKLRIVDGDHDWLTFREALPDLLPYLASNCQVNHSF